MTIELVNRSGALVPDKEMISLLDYGIEYMELNPECEISLSFVDVQEMEELHIKWMQEDGPTDVLSFPMDDLEIPAEGKTAEPGILGDIILCPEFAHKQAMEASNTFEAEMDMLLVHGVLHLLGHDHQEPEEHAVMFGMQNTILADLKVFRESGK